jgi:glucose-1-phosphatase
VEFAWVEQTISVVLFDMNDVLFRYARNLRIERLAQVCGRPAAAVEAAIWSSGFEDSGDEGVLDADSYLAGFGERVGFPLTQEAWEEALRAAVSPVPETLALAEAVRWRARVAVLTNNNLLVKRAATRVFSELQPIFGADFYVSAELGARKPAPEAYLRCVALLGGDPGATFFVDDNAENVAGAERAGLHAHQFRSAAQLEQALMAHSLL